MHKIWISIVFCLGLAGWAQAQDRTALFDAISERDIAALTSLLEAGTDPDTRQSSGLEATPLMWAASAKDPVYTQALLAAGADVNLLDVAGDPAINWAAYYGHHSVAAVLLDAGAETVASGHGDALEIAMRRGHPAMIALIGGARGQTTDRSTGAAALETALVSGDLETAAALAELYELSGARDWAGRPVIHAAARANQAEAVSWLTDHGVDPNAADSIGYTALMEAARDGASAAMAALIAAGADVNHKGAENGMTLTALHLAAIEDRADIVTQLLEAGAETEPVGVMGGTPLLWAIFEGSQSAALALASGGADPNAQMGDGPTARAMAEQQGWTDVVEALGG